MQAKPVYLIIANAVQARTNSITTGNTVWQDKWEEVIKDAIDNHLPSGSGFNSGTEIDLEKSHQDRLVFVTSYHHMNDAGYYDGWTDHTVTVTPNFGSINIRVSGRNRNGIKDYIAEMFYNALTATHEPQPVA